MEHLCSRRQSKGLSIKSTRFLRAQRLSTGESSGGAERRRDAYRKSANIPKMLICDEAATKNELLLLAANLDMTICLTRKEGVQETRVATTAHICRERCTWPAESTVGKT